jgi:hypothetical protein
MDRLYSTLTALTLIATSFAQTRPASPPPQKIFKSPDSAFEFRYPKSFVLCHPEYEQPTPDPSLRPDYVVKPQLIGWAPESCSAYMDICPMSLTTTETGVLHPATVACVAYPNSAYEGTNFGGGAFSVREVPDATTEGDCLQFDRFTTDAKKANWVTIGGVKFKSNSGGSGGLGHGMSEDTYLSFHNGKCYDVEIRMTQTSFDNFDPGTIKEFKNYGEVDAELRRVLNSFRFLK